MKRGDIYWANIWPRSGSEQGGKRPVLLISNDEFNQHKNWRSIIIIPLSTSSKQAMQRKKLIHSSKYLFFDLGVRRLCAKEGRKMLPERLTEFTFGEMQMDLR
ncbi:MAG: type II toxin-antitoxin system PemK/MazF family toxin [Deltaproteobacteria bacterium]|nr:type II toxin-antitoxin system PemK/MazF family toxin [Deltaproteobacteria bacterium]